MMTGLSETREVAESENPYGRPGRHSAAVLRRCAFSYCVNTTITIMAADAPKSTSSNEEDKSRNVDAPQESANSTAPSTAPATSHQSDSESERPQQHEHPVNPQVAALRAIFPDYDDGLL